MPLTPTVAKASVNVAIEAISGETIMMAATAVVATMSAGITQPTGGSVGSRVHLILYGWTAGGTLTINGTGVPGNTEVITVPAPTAQQLQSPQLANFEYESVNLYTAITNFQASAPLVTGGGVLVVKACQGGKFNIPVTAFKGNYKAPLVSPNEHNSLMARDKKLIATVNEAAIDAWDSEFYGDLSLYWVYLMCGSPSWSTLPAAPLSIVASATIIASMTIANQPTAPGMKLIIVASTWASGASITIVGTSYGIATTEVITIGANGTYYSANVYSAITSIGGTTNATTLVITGVFGWKGTVTSESTRQTAVVEHFDGNGSWVFPFSYTTDGDMTIPNKAEVKVTLKGGAQDKIPIGDRTTNPLNVSRVASIGAPLSDLPVGGWQTNVYIDAITGTAQTTVFGDPDEEIKVVLKAPVEPHWTFVNQQEYSRAYPIKPEVTVDVTYDIINLLQFEQNRQNLKQYLVVQVVGEYIGTSAGTLYYKGWTWTLPVRYEEYGQEGDPGRGNVFAKPKLRTEYDAGIGGSYLLTIITRNPPTYNL